MLEIPTSIASHREKQVDLVDLTRANTVMAKDVLRTGILMADAQPVLEAMTR